jgi:hypothetical protein
MTRRAQGVLVANSARSRVGYRSSPTPSHLEIDPSSLTLAVPEHHQDQTPPVRQDSD